MQMNLHSGLSFRSRTGGWLIFKANYEQMGIHSQRHEGWWNIKVRVLSHMKDEDASWGVWPVRDAAKVISLFFFFGSTGSSMGFPGGSDGKESVCIAGDLGSIPGLGRSPGGRPWWPIPVFLPGDSHGQRRLAGYSPQGHKESDTPEWMRQGFHYCA